jgi:hypothetical protein
VAAREVVAVPVTGERHESGRSFAAYLEEAAEILAVGRRARGRRRQLLGGALRHALAFSTWRSLSVNGIARQDAVRLAMATVEAAEESPAGPAGRGARSAIAANQRLSSSARSHRIPRPES